MHDGLSGEYQEQKMGYSASQELQTKAFLTFDKLSGKKGSDPNGNVSHTPVDFAPFKGQTGWGAGRTSPSVPRRPVRRRRP